MLCSLSKWLAVCQALSGWSYLLDAVERRLPLALIELGAEGRDQGVGVDGRQPLVALFAADRNPLRTRLRRVAAPAVAEEEAGHASSTMGMASSGRGSGHSSCSS